MRNIADQFFAFPVTLQLLLCIISQTDPHLFKCLHQPSHLIIFFRLDLKIQIAFFYVLRCFLQLVNRTDDTSINPHHHDHRCKCQNQDYCDTCAYNKLLDLRHISQHSDGFCKIFIFLTGNSISMLNDSDLITRNSKYKCRCQDSRYHDHRHKRNHQFRP